MKTSSMAVFGLATFILLAAGLSEARERPLSSYWVVHIDEATDPRKIADETQFEYMGKVLDGEPLHRFRLRDHAREKRVGHTHTRRLMSHPQIRSATQEEVLDRKKRDFIDLRDLYGDEDQVEVFREKRLESELKNEDLLKSMEYKRRKEIDDIRHLFNDPYWGNQWYLHDTRSDPLETKLDLHVYPVWKRGFTGKGVTVTVIDDGLLRSHPDLVKNYEPAASFDFNGDHGHDPMPRPTKTDMNKHGTRCAGEISMTANNSICGVGVAFNSRIGGIRILDGMVTDSVEASSLGFGLDIIDIFSASWGPTDNGETMEGPGVLATKAMETGVSKGRKGKGVIYIWAGGNGGSYNDDCACDGYASSIYTIAISSVTSQQSAPKYIELCPAIMATTFSGVSGGRLRVVGTDLHNKCTDKHGGTSASAPLAAGIMALALEANPSLTWRDAQHLVAWTSEVAPILKNLGWMQNGAGFFVNVRFGFGLMNADAVVKLANKTTWKSVPEKSICKQSNILDVQRRLASGRKLTVSLLSDGCKDTEDEINFLEHVQVNLTVSYSRRGSLSIQLTSPCGMKTQLLKRRSRDKSDGLWSWVFTTVHNWGENPRGIWTLDIDDRSDVRDNEGLLAGFEMIFHGTKLMPDHMQKSPAHRRPYNMNYNSVKNVRSELTPADVGEGTEQQPRFPFLSQEGLQRHRPYPEDLEAFLRVARQGHR